MSNPPPDEQTRIGQTPACDRSAGAPGPAEFATGEVIGGNYKVLGLIGRGGMGAVYRVHHLFLDKDLALKTLSGDQITEVAWRRFQIEGQAIARLDHPSIIRIYDLGVTSQNQPYYVMDLVQGFSLAEIIKQQGALRPETALPIFRQLCAGLAYAHERGIIHRDLKPANIMILPAAAATGQASQSTQTAKILDFGLAKLTDLASGGASGLTKTGEIFGSPLYMSPEQAKGLAVDQRSDVYSFGCTLFDALTGRPPFKGANAIETMMQHQNKSTPTLHDIRPDLHFDQNLEHLVAKLLAKDPARRYQSFAEIASQLLTLERSRHHGLTSTTTEGLSSTDTLSSTNTLSNTVTSAADQGSGATTGEFTDPPGGREGLSSAKWFWPVLAAALASLLVLIAGAYYIAFFSRSGPLPQAETALPVTAARQPAETYEGAKTQTIAVELFSSQQDSAMGKMKVFNFPEHSIGKIEYELPALKGSQPAPAGGAEPGRKAEIIFGKGNARGKLVLPLAAELTFEPLEETCKTPIIFKNFQKDDLFKLVLTGNEYVDDDFMPFIKHLTGLKELQLKETNVDDRALKIIDHLINLHNLDIDKTKITGLALARSATLKRLTYLSYTDGTDLDALVAAACKNPEFVELRLDGGQLSRKSLELLAGLPHLRKLCVNDCGVGDDGIKILAGSKSIRSLDLHDRTLTSKSFDVLAGMHLTKLSIWSIGWSAEDQARLRKIFKNPDGLQIKTPEF